MLRVKAERRVPLRYERFHGSAGARKQQESQRDLACDQETVRVAAARAASELCAACLNESAKLRTRELICRRNAKENSGEQGNRGAEDQNHAVNMNRGLVRERIVRQHCGESFDSPISG